MDYWVDQVDQGRSTDSYATKAKRLKRSRRGEHGEWGKNNTQQVLTWQHTYTLYKDVRVGCLFFLSFFFLIPTATPGPLRWCRSQVVRETRLLKTRHGPPGKKNEGEKKRQCTLPFRVFFFSLILSCASFPRSREICQDTFFFSFTSFCTSGQRLDLSQPWGLGEGGCD